LPSEGERFWTIRRRHVRQHAIWRPRRKRINVNQDYELSDWSKKFGVRPDELRAAVRDVGDDADKVKEHLSRNNAR
jgi:hypothetical protein